MSAHRNNNSRNQFSNQLNEGKDILRIDDQVIEEDKNEGYGSFSKNYFNLKRPLFKV